VITLLCSLTAPVCQTRRISTRPGIRFLIQDRFLKRQPEILLQSAAVVRGAVQTPAP